MRILVCGDREWSDIELIYDKLSLLPTNTTIIHGGCRGADIIAGVVGEALGLKVEVYEADWSKHHTAAGPIRNRVMLDTKPNLIIVFHDNLSKSRGTADCVNEANRRGLQIIVIRHA